MKPAEQPGRIYELPSSPDPTEQALEDLDLIYAYLYARVGNRPDAEDLTQQVALKAIPRLKPDAAPAAVRAYLFAAARSVLASHWSRRLGVPEEQLLDDLSQTEGEAEEPEPMERVRRILDALPANYRRLLELRFLRGYSLKEVARETGTTPAAAKIMQWRALRAAAEVNDAR
ncbi:MAG: sigma-70 family RNA polymerase sigma factor [Candidatus Dormibacteraeota bacterium]|nr:sigma-70 family RNA polymerase sigma factor [Candidatus Dormibacteraeota bacterium]